MATQAKESQINTTQQKGSGFVQNIGRDVKPIQAFFTKFTNDWSMNLSAMLAYNLLMAMFPIFIALVSILGLILGTLDPNAKNQLIQQIEGVLPASISSTQVLKPALSQLAKDSGILGIIAIILALFNGSRLFINIEGCFGIIYHVRQRPLLKQNLMAFGMLLLFVILIPVMSIASAGPAFVFSILKQTPLSLIPGSGILFGLGGVLGSLIVSWILFQTIYMVIPNQRISFRNSLPGAIVAAIALEIYLALFPLYTTRFLGGFAGTAGLFVILLIFFYYFAVILLLGAEVNAFFAEGVTATPVDLVTLVHIATSHLPKRKEDKDQQAAASHKEAPTGSTAAKTHIDETVADPNLQAIAAITTATAPTPKTETRHEPQTVPVHEEHKTKHEEHKTKKEKPKQATSRVGTMLEAVAGTALAFVVELVRIRRRKPQ